MSLIASKSPAKVFVSGRNKTRADALIAKVKSLSSSTDVVFVECDLSSLASVQLAAENILSQTSRLDVLMCNAGVMALPPGLSKDGYEIQFATNHLGHALLIKLLLPILLSTAEQLESDVRIVSMSSSAHATTPKKGIELDTLKTSQKSLGPIYQPSNFTRYGQSKLANMLYTAELATRYPNITSVSVHPGFVRTEMVSGASFLDRTIVSMASGGNWTTVEEGPYNQTWAATTAKGHLKNGAYYEPIGVQVNSSSAHAKDRVLSQKLWDWTEQELLRFQK